MEIFKLLKGRPLKIMELLGAELRITGPLGTKWKKSDVSVREFVEMDVTTIERELRSGSQSSVSQDLTKLRKAGLLDSERRGLHIFYKLSDKFPEILNALGALEVAIPKHYALGKGKNRQLVVKWLKEYPGSKSADICPELSRSTVSHELAVLRKARVLRITTGEERKKLYSLKQ